MLQQTVVKEKCHAGLATDGDADRIGAIAEDGSFVDSHKMLRRSPALAAGAQEVARRRGARLQHHRHGGSHRRQVRTQADRVPHRIQVHCRPDDGARNCDRRRRIRRHRIFALSAGARRHSELPAAGQRDGRGGQAAGPAGGRSAARVRAALLRTPRSAHHRRDEAKRHPAGRAPTRPTASAATPS